MAIFVGASANQNSWNGYRIKVGGMSLDAARTLTFTDNIKNDFIPECPILTLEKGFVINDKICVSIKAPLLLPLFLLVFRQSKELVFYAMLYSFWSILDFANIGYLLTEDLLVSTNAMIFYNVAGYFSLHTNITYRVNDKWSVEGTFCLSYLRKEKIWGGMTIGYRL